MNSLGILVDLSHCGRSTAENVIRHLEHTIMVAGEDHVSIGTDGYISPTELTPEYREQFAKHTRERARVMGCDDELGSIEPGKLADLVLVDGKQDQDIRDIRKIDTIIIDGVDHTSDKLDRAVGVK